MASSEPLPPGLIPVTVEMLDPNGPLATHVRTESAKARDASPDKSGEGWEGSIDGFCPVQGQGTVDGLNWYFRARHSAWSFEVWREAFGPDGALPQADPRAGALAALVRLAMGSPDRRLDSDGE